MVKRLFRRGCDIQGKVALDLFMLVGVPAGVGVPDRLTVEAYSTVGPT